eukprot:scaffold287428_cov35-Tisochrysis_lutea.AAC.1
MSASVSRLNAHAKACATSGVVEGPNWRWIAGQHPVRASSASLASSTGSSGPSCAASCENDVARGPPSTAASHRSTNTAALPPAPGSNAVSTRPCTASSSATSSARQAIAA